MDKTIAAIKIGIEFMLGAIFYSRMVYNEELVYPKYCYLLSMLLFMGLFEVAFYWHVLR